MITFNISTNKCLVNIACDDSSVKVIGDMLEKSSDVRAFNTNGKQYPNWSKYSKSLSQENQDAMTDDEVNISILNAIFRIDERREKEFGGCHYESFIGGPGDFSPPNCDCERCIAAGRAYRFNTRLESIDSKSYHELYKILQPMAKKMRWGIEYTELAKCRITLYDTTQDVWIRTNKEDIRIGPYAFSHKTKKFKHVN